MVLYCRHIAPILAGALLLACSAEDGDDVDAPGSVGAPLEIEAEPRLTLGVVEGDTIQEFHRIVSPFLMPDGRLVVPLSDAGTLRVFAANGTYIRSLGRPGSGPGEFSYIGAAWPRGDTIEVLDGMRRRIVRFTPDDAIDEIGLPATLRDASRAFPLGEGWAVAGVASAGNGQRDRLVMHHISRDGADHGELAATEGMARFGAPGLGSGPEPLSPNGVLTVRNDRVYVGETLTPLIRVVDAEGGALREIRWQPAQQPDPHAVLNEVIDSALARTPAAQTDWARRRFEAAPVPGALSIFWDVLVDELDFVWIRSYEPLRHAFALGGRAGAGGAWRVFAPDGQEVGDIVMPADLEPVQITRDAVVGIARDDLGVERIRVHELRRR